MTQKPKPEKNLSIFSQHPPSESGGKVKGSRTPSAESLAGSGRRLRRIRERDDCRRAYLTSEIFLRSGNERPCGSVFVLESSQWKRAIAPYGEECQAQRLRGRAYSHRFSLARLKCLREKLRGADPHRRHRRGEEHPSRGRSSLRSESRQENSLSDGM